MRKLFKKGAAALAIALSIACAIPSTVSAAGYPTVTVGLRVKKSHSSYESTLISYDDQVIYQSTDSSERNKEYLKLDEKTGNYRKASRTRNGVTTFYIIKRVYKNEVTGNTGNTESDVAPSGMEDYEVLNDKVYVNAGEPTRMKITLLNGDTKIGKVKSSKKKVVTAKLDKKNSVVSVTGEHAHVTYNLNDDCYFYYKSNGERVVLPKKENGYCDRESAEYKNSNGSSAEVCILLYPKKTGKSKVSFNVYNKDGALTGKISVNVIVRSDSDIFKKVTFGGKSLIQKKFGDKNYINYGRRASSSSYDYNLTNKAKGKLIVKPNKGIKVLKIMVGSYQRQAANGYHYDEYTNSCYEEDVPGNRTSQYTNGVYRGYDMNSDGDALDKIYGQKESDICYHYKEVKSGSTIKLSKVGSVANYCDGRRYFKEDDLDCSSVAITKKSSEYAPTKIMITYYDEEYDYYGTSSFVIYRKAKKYKM